MFLRETSHLAKAPVEVTRLSDCGMLMAILRSFHGDAIVRDSHPLPLVGRSVVYQKNKLRIITPTVTEVNRSPLSIFLLSNFYLQSETSLFSPHLDIHLPLLPASIDFLEPFRVR